MRLGIIGAGQATASLLHALKRQDFKGSITVFNGEPHRPYQRPPLSKTFLDNPTPEWLLPDAWMQDPVIEWVDQPAIGIDPNRGSVNTEASTHTFDHLVLATGTRAIKPPIDGLPAERHHTLRTLTDAQAIAGHIDATTRVVIQGSGFLAFEMAHALKAHVASTVIALKSDHAMPQLSREIATVLVKQSPGECRMHAAILRYETDTRSLITDQGPVACDCVISAVGATPNTELAEPWGLTDAWGIVVDSQMQTAHAKVSAIGEVVSHLNPHTQKRMRVESIAHANDTAAVLADRLTDRDAHFKAVPWFWSDQGADKLQIAGLADRDDAATCLMLEAQSRVVVRHLGDRVTAVETLNQAREFMAARRLFEQGPVRLSALKSAGSAFGLLQSSRS